MVKPGAPGLLETSWRLRLPGQALNSLSRPTRILPIWPEHARSSISPKQKRHRPACRRSSAAARSGIQSFRLAASCPGQIASSCTSSVLHLMLHSGWISLIEHRTAGWRLDVKRPVPTSDKGKGLQGLWATPLETHAYRRKYSLLSSSTGESLIQASATE